MLSLKEHSHIASGVMLLIVSIILVNTCLLYVFLRTSPNSTVSTISAHTEGMYGIVGEGTEDSFIELPTVAIPSISSGTETTSFTFCSDDDRVSTFTILLDNETNIANFLVIETFGKVRYFDLVECKGE